MTAARRSFTGLLVPGTLALITAFVGFATLVLVPIPMIRELAITASVGVAYKIVTNLIMLPVLASYFSFDAAFVARAGKMRSQRVMHDGQPGRAHRQPRNALPSARWSSGAAGGGGVAEPGPPCGACAAGRARAACNDSRYNQDVEAVVSRFGLGLDMLTVVVETPKDGCYQA
jgi:hypothetical protein